MTDNDPKLETIDVRDCEPTIQELGAAAIGMAVCYVGIGSGITPYHKTTESASLVRTVSKCAYPWQIPIGIVASVGTDTIQVQTSGTFTRRVGYDQNAELYGAPYIGVRVYVDVEPYSATSTLIGKYSCVTAIGSTRRGRVPGAATIGYVSQIDDDIATITIDPQPARATYKFVKINGVESRIQGVAVRINQSTGYSAKWVPGDVYCDGAHAGLSINNNLPEYKNFTFGVICTHGPAWLWVSKDKLFARHSLDYLMVHSPSPHKIPIGADLALMSGPEDIGSGPDRVPRLGYIWWEDWYALAKSEDEYMMIEVDLSNPTPEGMDPYEDHLILETLVMGFTATSSDNWPYTVVRKSVSVEFVSDPPAGITLENRALNMALRAYLPCDTPIGIAKDFFEDSHGDYCTVAVKGSTFWVDGSRLKIREKFPISSSANITSRTVVGTRLYHDVFVGDFFIATDYVDYDADDEYGLKGGWYPGSATIGYISAIHETATGVTKYQITIDPQPATADYLIGPWEYPESAIGTKDTDPNYIRAVYKLQGRMGICSRPPVGDMITAVGLNVKRLVPNTTKTHRVAIAVRRGYTWWPLSDNELYAYHTRQKINDYLSEMDYAIYNMWQGKIPLTQQGAIIMFPDPYTPSGNNPIIIGYLVGSYTPPQHTDPDRKYPYLVYIDPETPIQPAA